MFDHFLPTHRKHGERLESEVRLLTLTVTPQWHTYPNNNTPPLKGSVSPPDSDPNCRSSVEIPGAERHSAYLNHNNLAQRTSNLQKIAMKLWIVFPSWFTVGSQKTGLIVRHLLDKIFIQWLGGWRRVCLKKRRECSVLRSAGNLTYFLSKKFTWPILQDLTPRPTMCCSHLITLSLWYFI